MNEEHSENRPRNREDTPLQELDVFSPDDLRSLQEYAIYTLGQLLGATKGLTICPPFLADPDSAQNMFGSIAERFPEEVERHRSFDQPFPATGAFLEHEDEGDANDQP